MSPPRRVRATTDEGARGSPGRFVRRAGVPHELVDRLSGSRYGELESLAEPWGGPHVGRELAEVAPPDVCRPARTAASDAGAGLCPRTRARGRRDVARLPRHRDGARPPGGDQGAPA